MVFQDLSKEQISIISKFIVYHCFRNGPIEDIHSDGKISQDQMKEIMKSSVTEVAAVMDGFINQRGPFITDWSWLPREIQKGWDDPDWEHVKKLNER